MSKIWNYFVYLGMGEKNNSLDYRNNLMANRLNLIMLIILVLLNIITAVIREMNDGEYTIHTKKLLFLLFISVVFIVLARYKRHKLNSILLIFMPPPIIILLPAFLGQVQEVDFTYNPLILMSLSFIPNLILKPDLSNKLYVISFTYFLILFLMLDSILIHFSNNGSTFLIETGENQIYYKMVLITVFVFIQSAMFYLRHINYKYEAELHKNNEELKKTLEELTETQYQLVQAEKMASLGVLSAGIAHEINNPLNFIHGGILGLENYINDNLPEHSLNVEPLLNAVNIGVKRASEIVTSLNHYSRKDDLPPTECDVHEIIDNGLIMLHNKLKNKVEIKKNYTSDNCVVFGSEGKLHQAFLNIISNAEQAIKDKGIIEINTMLKQKSVVVSIIDTGGGINPENIQKIFDPFFTTKEPGKGTGLGMAITYNIIKEHNGTIEYESVLGIGTKAVITLPRNKEIPN